MKKLLPIYIFVILISNSVLGQVGYNTEEKLKYPSKNMVLSDDSSLEDKPVFIVKGKKLVKKKIEFYNGSDIPLQKNEFESNEEMRPIKIKTVMIDFKNISGGRKEMFLFPNLKEGDYYRLQVKNINLNLYKVEVAAKDTILSKKQETPMFTGTNLDNLSKIVTELLNSNGLVSLDRSNEDRYVAIKSDSSTPATDNDEQTIEDRMDKEKKKIKEENDKLGSLYKDLGKLKLDIFKLKLSSVSDLHKVEISPNFNIDDFYNRITKVVNTAAEIKISLVVANSYEVFSEQNKVAINKKAELKDKDQQIKTDYALLSASVKEVLSAFTDEKVVELLTPLAYIINNKSEVYTSLPIQMLGERTKIKVSFIPRDDKMLLQKYSFQIALPEIIKYYTSVGLAFYHAPLYDQTYGIGKSINGQGDIQYVVKENESDHNEIGIAALLKYGMKFGLDSNCRLLREGFFGIHGNLGAGLSISSKVKPRVLVGAGLSFGRRHMLSIDSGMIVGYVDRINEAALSGTFDEVPQNVLDSKVESKLFFGIGYIYQF